jgi:hypothetical protein
METTRIDQIAIHGVYCSQPPSQHLESRHRLRLNGKRHDNNSDLNIYSSIIQNHRKKPLSSRSTSDFQSCLENDYMYPELQDINQNSTSNQLEMQRLSPKTASHYLGDSSRPVSEFHNRTTNVSQSNRTSIEHGRKIVTSAPTPAPTSPLPALPGQAPNNGASNTSSNKSQQNTIQKALPPLLTDFTPPKPPPPKSLARSLQPMPWLTSRQSPTENLSTPLNIEWPQPPSASSPFSYPIFQQGNGTNVWNEESLKSRKKKTDALKRRDIQNSLSRSSAGAVNEAKCEEKKTLASSDVDNNIIVLPSFRPRHWNAAGSSGYVSSRSSATSRNDNTLSFSSIKTNVDIKPVQGLNIIKRNSQPLYLDYRSRSTQASLSNENEFDQVHHAPEPKQAESCIDDNEFTQYIDIMFADLEYYLEERIEARIEAETNRRITELERRMSMMEMGMIGIMHGRHVEITKNNGETEGRSVAS